MTRRAKEKRNMICTLIGMILITFLVDMPIISMIGTSFKKNDEVLSTTSMFPRLGGWSLENFIGVFQKTDFARKMGNSFFISICATLLCIIVSAMAGYALARFRGRAMKGFSALLFLMQMFPGMLLLIPMFVLFSRFGMVNSLPSLIIYYAAGNLAFNIMMIRSFFETIPIEMEEAARVDGCGNFSVFLRIILPVSGPGMATVGIMTFLNCWNEFTFASLLLRKPEIQTLTVGLRNFVQQNDSNWGYLMGASTIAIIPALIFLIFAQKYLVQGLTAGSVKG